MSVVCSRVKGFTVNLPVVKSFDELEEIFGDELDSLYFSNYSSKPGKAYLFPDSYDGEYFRLCYAENTGGTYDFTEDDEQYFKLQDKEIPEETYNQLNYLYKKIMNEELDKSKIEYALFYQWG